MNAILISLFCLIGTCFLALGAINIYLVNLVRKLERELDDWEVPW